jgi:hypothetical protein
MGYVFSGFFAADPSLLGRALEQWPTCRGRIIERPFWGFGIAFLSWHLARSAEAEVANDEFILEAQKRLVDWSKDFPSTNFVWIEAECFGGACLYYGFVYRNGESVAVGDVNDDIGSDQNLLQLLTYLGVNQPTRYFEPFTRGYFDTPEK